MAIKPAALVGGDPTLTRAAMLDPAFAAGYARSEAARSIEVPCQQCGRACLVAPSGQRVALGEGEPLVELDTAALAENRIATVGAPQPSEACPVLCMFCAFAKAPEVINALQEALAKARRALGEV